MAALLAAPAFADCPPVPDRSDELDRLFEAIQAAPNEMAGREINGRMWEIWTDAPDEAAQALLDRGVAALRVSNFLGALDAFGRLIEYCPDYAEGYNQRAFVYFLNGEFERALPDLHRVVEIEPRHVGALTGLGLTLTALGREAEAQDWLRRAVALNPWVSERHLLKEPPGEEL